MADLRPALARTLARPGALIAAVTSLGVFSILVAQGLLGAVLQSLTVLVVGLGGLQGGSPSVDIWSATPLDVLVGLPGQVVVRNLGILLGVALSLGVLAPVTVSMRLHHVVGRSLLAAVVAGVVLAVFGVGQALLGLLPSPPFGLPHVTITGLWWAFLGGASTVVQIAPIVVLAAILVWGGARRRAPHEERQDTDHGARSTGRRGGAALG